jgi:hypothetical protein
MFSKKIKCFAVLSVFLLLSLLFLPRVFQALSLNRILKNYLLSRAGAFTGYELAAEHIHFDFAGGLRITVNEFSGKSGSDNSKFAAASLELTLDAGEIIRGRLVPKRLLLTQPEVEPALAKSRKTTGMPDFDTLLSHNFFKSLDKIDYVSINAGRIFLEDQNLTLDNLFLQLSPQEHNKNRLNVDIYGRLEFNKEKACFFTRGDIDLGGSGNQETMAGLMVRIKELPLTWFRSPRSLPVEKGRADAVIDLKIMPPGLTSINGRLLVSDLCFLVDKAKGVKEYSLPEAVVCFKADYRNKIFDISEFNIKTDDYSLHASALLDLRNKADPYLDLKVSSPFMALESFKTVFPTPLVSQWLENRLYPCFKKGGVRLDLFALQGSFSRLKRLNKRENAECLALKLSLKDLEIVTNKSAPPYTVASARLLINDGNLAVSDVKGAFGSSVVNSGSMRINDLYSKMAFFSYYLQGLFDLGDIKQQAETAPLPEGIKTWIQKIAPVSGKVEAEVRCGHLRGFNNPTFQKSVFKLKECSITVPELNLPLRITEAEFCLDDDARSKFYARGLIGRSGFTISGQDIGIYKQGKAEISFNADLDEILQTIMFQESPESMKFKCFIPGRAAFAWKKGKLWSCKGELDPGALEIYPSGSAPDKRGLGKKIDFNLDIIPGEKFLINHIGFNSGKTLIDLSGFFDLQDMDIFHLKTAAVLRFEDIKFLFQGVENPPEGRIRCSAEIKKSVTDLSGAKIFGKCEGEDISVSGCALPFELADCNFKAGFSGSELLISFFEATLGNSFISFKNSSLHGWNGIKGVIDIDAGYLDIAGLIAGNKAECRRPKRDLPDFIKNSNLKLNISSNQGAWKQIEYDQLSTTLIFKNGRLDIENCDIRTASGALKITGHTQAGLRPETVFDLHVKLDQQPIENILHSLDVLKSVHISGAALTTEGDLMVQGIDKKEIISSITGRFNLMLDSGVIKKSNLFFSTLNFLSLNNIVDKKPSDFSGKGFRFNSIKGNMEIKNEILKIDSFVMQSPIFNMAGNGYIDLNKDKVDLNLVVSPLGTIDLLLTKIPVVGYVLTGKEKSIITFYLNVHGSQSKPKIRYVPFQHWPASIFGFVKRTLMTPGRLLRDAQKAKSK